MDGLGNYESSKLNDALTDLMGAGSSPINVRATVTRKDASGVSWAMVNGKEFPLQGTTVQAQPGEYVNVSYDGVSAYSSGNYTDPAIGAEAANGAIRAAVSPVYNMAQKSKEEAEKANKIASEAAAVASATNQHFWDDDSGAHVTDVTQDEWHEAEADDFSDASDQKPYHNLLMNSLGILLRTALKNLVSITKSAIAFFDGEGNGSSNIVARFGSDGAQIGKTDASHLTLGEDSLSIVNQYLVAMFDVDMDAGYTYILTLDEPDRREGQTSVTITSAGEYEVHGDIHLSLGTVRFPGDKLIIPSGSELGYNVTQVKSSPPYWANVSIQSLTAGITYSFVDNVNHGTTIYTLTEDLQFIYGTATQDKVYTIQGTIEDTRNATLLATFTTTITLAYDGGYELYITMATAYTVSAITENGFQGSIHHTWPRHKLYKLTKGAAFTFGTRQADNDSGLLSACFGEGLISEQSHQLVAGKFNLKDTNDDYALIIGNGTADDARSNALAVQWDGTLETATPIPVTSGGTGCNAVLAYGGTTAAAVSAIITLESGWSVSEIYFARWGKVGQLYMICKRSSAITVPAGGDISPDITIGTLNAGFRPRYNTYWTSLSAGGLWGTMNTGGGMAIAIGNATGTQHSIAANTQLTIRTGAFVLA